MFMGCESFLDTDNLTKKDSSSFPKTEADVNMLIAATYQGRVIGTIELSDV